MTFYIDAVEVTQKVPSVDNALVSKSYEDSETAVYTKQINFLNSWLTTLFTTLADRGYFIATEVWIVGDSITSITTAPTINIGISTTYTWIVSGRSWPSSSFISWNYLPVTVRTNTSSRLRIAPSTNVAINLTAVAVAAAYTATLIVKGYYEGST